MAGRSLTIEWSAGALADLGRFAAFLEDAAPDLAAAIAGEIIAKTRIVGERPSIGRPIGETDYRQFVIRALNAPYVVRYRVDEHRVLMLRIFHGRESRG